MKALITIIVVLGVGAGGWMLIRERVKTPALVDPVATRAKYPVCGERCR